MLQWILENTLIAVVMAAGVCLACRVFRARPAVCHFLWVLVLVRLVAPPVSVTQWPPASMRSQLAGWFDKQASTVSTQVSQIMSLPGGTQLADNRSVGSSSAAPVQPNPIELALLPEEIPAAAPPAAPSDSNTKANWVEGGKPTTAPGAETPTGYAYASESKGQQASGDRSMSSPPPSDATMSKLDQSEMAWREFYADKSAIRSATPSAAVTSGSAGWLLRRTSWAIASIWLLGAIVALVVQIRRIARFHRAVLNAAPASAWLKSRVQNLADELGTLAPPVRLMPGLSSPVIWGFGTPTLLWPADDTALAQRDGQRCDGIIVHELAHLRRRDHWLAWFEIVALSLLWWHPLAHLACRRLHEFADLACDSWVVSMLPTHRRTYAASIVDLIEQLSTAPRAALALGVGTSSRRALVERRLVMIVKERTSCRLSPVAALLALTTAAFLVPSWAGGAVERFAPPAQVSLDSAIALEHQPLIKQAILKRRAETYFKGQDWESAADAYQALLERDPDNAQVAQRLTTCLVAIGELERAQTIIEKSIDKSNEPALSHYHLACVLAKRGEKDAAFKELGKAITFGFNQSELLNTDIDLGSLRGDDRFRAIAGDALLIASLQQQAQQALVEEDGQTAAAFYGELTRIAPNSGQAQHMLSYASILASRDASSEAARTEYLDQARKAEQTQLKLNFLPAVARYNMACVDALEGQVEAGLKNLQASIELGFEDAELMTTDPDLEALRSSGRFDTMLSQIEQHDNPQEAIELALENDDLALAASLLKDADARADLNGALSSSLGYRFHGNGQYADAEQFFARALKHGYGTGDMVYNLACCEALRGNTQAALGYLDASVDAGYTDFKHMLGDEDLSPLRNEKRFEKIVNKASDASVLDGFGVVDWSQLFEQAQKEIAADSTSGKAQHRFGWALLRLGRPQEAIAAFSRQRDLGYAPQIAGYNIACCQVKLGHEDAALDILAQLAGEDSNGALNADLVANDPDLKALRDNPRFAAIVKTFPEQKPDASEAKAKAKERAAAGMKGGKEAALEVGPEKEKPGR